MKKVIKVEVSSKQKAAKEFIDAWHSLESTKHPETSSNNKLYFESAEALLQALTPKRLELLRAIHQEKQVSIRAIAKRLNRDYKNVHGDTQILENLSLLVKNKNGLLSVPWDTIITEIPMKTPTKTPKKSRAKKRTKRLSTKKRAAG